MKALRVVCQEIIREARKQGVNSITQLNKVKMRVLTNHPEISEIPNNATLMVCASEEDREALKNVLLMKPSRTISGVSPIALMTDPYPCPHTMKGIGPCSYCPGGPGSPWGDVPQSYTGEEPSTRRSSRNKYDPYLGVFNRLEHYVAMNHLPEKVEIILQGGTFCFFPPKYQEYFVKYVFKAMNDFSTVFYKNGKLDMDRFTSFFELPATLSEDERTSKIHEKCLLLKGLNLKQEKVRDHALAQLFENKFLGKEESNEKTAQNEDANLLAIQKVLKKVETLDASSLSLSQVQEENETSHIRCVGLTIETKSDFGKLAQGNEMLRLGCTRVELGIQSIYDDVLEKTNRGNTVQDNIDSIRTLKDLGFKINAHYMPGLPETTEEMDRKGLKELFENSGYRPDMLKVYPCMVMKGTKLFEDYKKGLFTPLKTEKAAKLLAWFMGVVPPYVRIMRVQRDIPTFMTEDGVDKTNLRQYIEREMEKQNIVCKDIRAREAGHRQLRQKKKEELNPQITVMDYEASQGKEFFIQYEDEEKDSLLGYARLRFPSQQLREEITPTSALLRELHVFGSITPLGEEGELQHKGIGKMLLKKAEDICKEKEKDKMVVISGIGVREYYHKLGYHKEGPYMVKTI